MGFFIHLCYILTTNSFGVPILLYNSGESYPVKAIWKQNKRIRLLNTKKPESSPEITMSWRDNKN